MMINQIINFFIFIIAFYYCFISVLGFGEIFQKGILSKIQKDSLNLEFNGFYGLLLLTLISLITSLFLAHNFIHNSLSIFITLSQLQKRYEKST